MRLQLSIVALAINTTLGFATRSQAAPEPGVTTYHVAVDSAEFIGFGDYTGLSNPNYQRLTFLLSHTYKENALNNHFHKIGSYAYTGDPLNPTPALSGNNRLPEPYQGDDGLSLLPGSGAFAGKLVSGLGPMARPEDHIEEEYGNLKIAPIDELYQYDNAADPDGEFAFHPGHYLLNASGGAYKESVAGVVVGMKLVGLSDGLSIYDQSGTPLFSALNDVVTLGPGSDWSIDPLFAVDAAGPFGASYSATFVLTDLSVSPAYGDSAPFSFDFVAVPEPGSALLIALAGLGGVFLRRSR